MSDSNQFQVWTRQQTCEYLKISLPTLDKLVETGALRAYRLAPQVIRFRSDHVEALFQPA